jgi:alkylhydroperoxidase/carboxymuconolactone decarboxylase family protein YurZ
LDYTELLRRLAINDEHLTGECVAGAGPRCGMLDPKTMALSRVAALIAVGGAGPSFGAEASAAVNAGATAAEIVDVLVSIVSIVGVPCVVAAAPTLAMALGYEVDAALEQQAGW